MSETVKVKRVITVEYEYPYDEDHCGSDMTHENVTEYEENYGDFIDCIHNGGYTEVVTVDFIKGKEEWEDAPAIQVTFKAGLFRGERTVIYPLLFDTYGGQSFESWKSIPEVKSIVGLWPREEA